MVTSAVSRYDRWYDGGNTIRQPSGAISLDLPGCPARGDCFMTNTYTTVRRENYFQRLGNSFFGMLIGFLLILAGCWLLFWNDGRAVDAERGLKAGAREVVSLTQPRVDPANEGKLVHLSGPTASAGTITDPATGAQFPNALLVARKVEMFQWVQTSESTTKEKVGGTQETTTTYTYTKQWSEMPQDSSTFAQPDGHTNPEMPFSSERLFAGDATVGGFKLARDLIDRLGDGTAFTPAAPDGWRVESGTLIRGAGTATEPQLGDLRVTYATLQAGTVVSIVAGQAGSELVPWTRRGTNYEVYLATQGAVPAGQMITEQRENEQTLTWILRVVGTIMNMIGFGLLLGPLKAIANVFPPLAGLVGGGIGLVAMALGLPLSLIVIATAWLVFRPLLAGGLIVAGIALFVFLARRKAEAEPNPAT